MLFYFRGFVPLSYSCNREITHYRGAALPNILISCPSYKLTANQSRDFQKRKKRKGVRLQVMKVSRKSSKNKNGPANDGTHKTAEHETDEREGWDWILGKEGKFLTPMNDSKNYN